jgi:hypothetical protein
MLCPRLPDRGAFRLNATKAWTAFRVALLLDCAGSVWCGPAELVVDGPAAEIPVVPSSGGMTEE